MSRCMIESFESFVTSALPQVSLQPRSDAINVAGRLVSTIDDVGKLGARSEAYLNCRSLQRKLLRDRLEIDALAGV